ncbi:uncharacterized protein LOC119767469 [Culex quinquefasciatus]|uniref:uncharacterized protein LOC119767469 n=1 Tax=Culex quinquefasciatus TaxID=7176 RepID=UPI0018E3C1EE|nr:uncharacterized protein LOC119767469 [Culex quinquefasciatus]
MRQSSVPIRTPGGRAASNDSNEPRKWREIFEHQLSPRGTNDAGRKRTINYELSRDGASDATTSAIVTQRIRASLKDDDDGGGGRRDGMKPSLVLKCDPKTYVLNLKIKVPRDSDGKKQEQQSGESGSKK